MTIGERIRAARELRGMDHQDLALKASLNAWEIAVFENGAAVILVPTLIRLCDALNVSADYLLGRIDTIETNAKPQD